VYILTINSTVNRTVTILLPVNNITGSYCLLALKKSHVSQSIISITALCSKMSASCTNASV